MRLTVLVPIVLVLAGLSGCRSWREDPCSGSKPYQAAGSVPPLIAPEGVAAPNTRNALKIPEPSGVAPAAKNRCLEQPPRFYDDSGKPAAATPKAPPPKAPATDAPPPTTPTTPAAGSPPSPGAPPPPQ